MEKRKHYNRLWGRVLKGKKKKSLDEKAASRSTENPPDPFWWRSTAQKIFEKELTGAVF